MFRLSVITSYSIHYTKLYEGFMDTSKNSILVPYDFTEVADNAVLHAIKTGKMMDADIYLLHIVKNRITSYNVCYTKLLRQRFVKEYRMVTRSKRW